MFAGILHSEWNFSGLLQTRRDGKLCCSADIDVGHSHRFVVFFRFNRTNIHSNIYNFNSSMKRQSYTHSLAAVGRIEFLRGYSIRNQDQFCRTEVKRLINGHVFLAS